MAYGSRQKIGWIDIWSNGYYKQSVHMYCYLDYENRKIKAEISRHRITSLKSGYGFTVSKPNIGYMLSNANRASDVRNDTNPTGTVTISPLGYYDNPQAGDSVISKEYDYEEDGRVGVYASVQWISGLSGKSNCPEQDWYTKNINADMPLMPRVEMPTNFRVDSVTSDGATFHWDKVDGAKSYLLDFYKDNVYTQSIPTNQTSLQIVGLEPNTNYKGYVRVQETEAHGKEFSTFTSNQSFTTLEAETILDIIPTVDDKSSCGARIFIHSEQIATSVQYKMSSEQEWQEVGDIYVDGDTQYKRLWNLKPNQGYLVRYRFGANKFSKNGAFGTSKATQYDFSITKKDDVEVSTKFQDDEMGISSGRWYYRVKPKDNEKTSAKATSTTNGNTTITGLESETTYLFYFYRTSDKVVTQTEEYTTPKIIPSPNARVSGNTSNSVTVTWDDIAVTYDIAVRVDGNLVENISAYNGTSYTYTSNSLTHDSVVKFMIIANEGALQSKPSAVTFDFSESPIYIQMNVSGSTKKTRIYVNVNNEAKTVKNIFVNVNGVAKKVL